jgi:hypothetical protein
MSNDNILTNNADEAAERPRGHVPESDGRGLIVLRTSRVVAGAGVVAAGALVWVALGLGGAFSASSEAGTPTARTTVTHPATTTQAQSTNSDPNRYPFGSPSGGVGVNVPSPPGEPTLAPTIATRTTTRLYGSNPFEEAVSVTQHIWPAALPENAANESNASDRPRGVTLLTPDDPLTAITATPLIHFPDDAPVLYVTKEGIPGVTLNELKRLGVTGMSRYNNVDAFLVGAAANPGVENQLKAIGMKYVTVTAGSIPDLANKVDQLYGAIQNPDTGVPVMDSCAQDVLIGSMDAYQYLLPATHWVAHMASGLLWVTQNSVPQATRDALKRRNGMARIYLFGGSAQISSAVAKQLAQYGAIIRITNDDEVGYNAPPTDNPIETAIVFAKMWDAAGEVGWKITGPGHGFTLVNINDWQGAVASAPLSHLGFHAPLLLTDNAADMPSEVQGYLTSVAPTFLKTPADGPYNMTYVLGSWDQISWPQQTHVDAVSEMGNRRFWGATTGGRYSDSQP